MGWGDSEKDLPLAWDVPAPPVGRPAPTPEQAASILGQRVDVPVPSRSGAHPAAEASWSTSERALAGALVLLTLVCVGVLVTRTGAQP